MERSPVISLLFHIRVLSLLLLLGSLDFHFIQHAYHSTVSKGASVQLVFGFEYAILLTVVVNIAIKYALHSVDLNSETPWDNKAVFLLYTELIMGLIKVILYVAFVAIMVRIYTLPLFAFRPMYYTIRNFKKAFSDVILSRRAIHNMNTLYPDATPEELQAADNVCIICREEMTTASKKLPCNHIFHTSCLRSWFQRQQTCPTCRLNILRTPTNNNEPRPRPPPPPVNPPQNPFWMFGQNNAAPQQPPPAPPVNPQQNTNIPPFVFPPFPFMPFMAPPPMPPPNLRTLSPEELRRMEGQERDNVEARIQCLRNIQVMLDAAVVMMQQYSAAATMSAQTPTGEQASKTTPSPTTSSVINNNTEDVAASTSDSTERDTPSTSATGLSSDEELRRRRLQRFQQNTD